MEVLVLRVGSLCSGPTKDPQDGTQVSASSRGDPRGWYWENIPRHSSGCISTDTSGWAVFNHTPCTQVGLTGSILTLSEVSELRQRTQWPSNPLTLWDFAAWPEPCCPGDLAHAFAVCFSGCNLFPRLKSGYLEMWGAPAWREGVCETSATCPELQLLLCMLRVHKCVSRLQMAAGISCADPLAPPGRSQRLLLPTSSWQSHPAQGGQLWHGHRLGHCDVALPGCRSEGCSVW